MKYNSRIEKYKSPFGAVKSGCALSFFLEGTQKASLELFSEGGRLLASFPLESCQDGCRVTVTAPEAGLYFYHFALEQGFAQRGELGEAVVTDGNGCKFQLTIYNDFDTPHSFKGGVMYQIFPDSFYASGKPKANVPRDREALPTALPPDHRPDRTGRYSNTYYGGDLAGITQKLPYLASLGVTMLYLNPIFEAHSNHRYNTADYMKIDPMLGDQADFEVLCKEAHRLGISVILDGVFNHTGDDSIYFNRTGRYGKAGAYNDPKDPHRSWYRFKPNGDYECWWDIHTLPDVNETDPSFVNFICGENGVISKWLSLGADGFRLDVADELPDEFIVGLRKAVKTAGQQKLLMGEVWEDASSKIAYGVRRRYLLGDELDGVMNYPFRKAIIQFLCTGHALPLRETVEQLTENYPAPVIPLLMNMLSTHDTARIVNELSAENTALTRDERRHYVLPRETYLRGVELVKLAFVLCFTLPGYPSVYYGDEIGMQGFEDPFCRGYYNWDCPHADLRPLMRELSHLRKNHVAFGGCECRFVDCYNGDTPSQSALAFVRKQGSDSVLIMVNRGDLPATLHLDGKEYTCPPWRHLIAVGLGNM